jgi:hypothetical protein
MKCAYHPKIEASATCANCNMQVCPDCYVPVENQNYCQSCIDEAFTRRWARPGAILTLISGIIAISAGMFLTMMALTPGARPDSRFGKEIEMGLGPDWVQAGLGIALMTLGLLAVIGSRYAFVRQHYRLAVAAGICTALCMPLLGIPALMLIVLACDEFGAIYVESCQRDPSPLLNRLH